VDRDRALADPEPIDPPIRSPAQPASRATWLRRTGVEPVLRGLGWILVTAADRATLETVSLLADADLRAGRRKAWRQRAARRAVASLGALRGLWVKAGQFAAHRPDVLPLEASLALADLRDRVPPLGLREITSAVEQELGAPIERRFRAFGARPIGAASLAQVHLAELEDGSPVAVKIQYPGLEDALAADRVLVRGALRVLARLAGHRGFQAEPLVAEFESGLRDELDFRREARFAAEIAANLSGDAAIVVPRVVASHSTRRVLTMEYRPTVRITDREGLARLGVAGADVVTIVARAYARQLFHDGLFHADPHPGNLFVLDEAAAAENPRVLFVDFGLSRRLTPELRRELRLGVYALIQRDAGAFVSRMQGLGMIAPGAEPGVRSAVERMFARIGQQGGALAIQGNAVLSLKDEAKALLRETPGLQLPHDLLLFARTLSYVFALGEELDAEVDLMKATLPFLLQFLAEKD
jgi:predicted unusual protein kinase regulating ubiquinone biosynthesis (AarF/ABC1/UbiB family)